MMEGSERGAARHRTGLEASRASLDDLVLHDEFLHALRLFLDIHDYDGRAPSVITADRAAGPQEVGKE